MDNLLKVFFAHFEGKLILNSKIMLKFLFRMTIINYKDKYYLKGQTFQKEGTQSYQSKFINHG